MNAPWDALVVGLGPAGAAAATALAAAGRRVLAVNRARFPRDKACGDTLTPRAFPALARLGVLEAVLAGARMATGYAWSCPDGRRQDVALPPAPDPRGYPHSLPRRVLDDLLRRRAEAAGAQVREAVRVTDLRRSRDGACWEVAGRDARGAPWTAVARLVLVADGARSRLLRRVTGSAPDADAWGLRAYYAEDAAAPRALEFHFDRRLTPGYAWAFPLPDGRVNVGLGLPAARCAALRGRLRAFFEDVLATHPQLRGRFAPAHRLGTLRAAPLGTRPRATSLPAGVVALGDAAGLADPFSGEGLPAALDSGLLVAELVRRHGLSPRALAALAAEFPRALARGPLRERPLSLLVRAAAGRPWVLDRAMDLSGWRPALAPHLAGVLAREPLRAVLDGRTLVALLRTRSA